MPTQDVLISLKFNNYNYAPGIATYGIDGKTGITGNDGNNIYFTDCDLINDTDNKNLDALAELLRANYLPVKGTAIPIARSYKNDDLFFDQNGIIYKLKNIDSLLGTGSKDVYRKYFSIAGKISIADYKDYFNIEGGRLILDSSNFAGFDIITSPNLSTNIDNNAVVNIISNNIDENDNIELVKMQSIDNVDIEDGNLAVYYKTTDNAYYLDSNMPIVINSNVKINDNTNNIDYDNYSSILTSNDTVTYFKHICDKLRYNVLYDSDENRYKLVIYQEDSKRNDLEYLVNRNETVYGKVYTDNNELILVRLSDIIDDSSIDSSKYYEHVDFKYLNVSVEDLTLKNIRVYDNKSSEVINTTEMDVSLNNEQHIIDISIKTSLPTTMGKFNNIIIESNNNTNKISLQFVIDASEYTVYNGIIYNNSTIDINICPNNYILNNSSTYFPSVTYPIKIQLKTDNTLNTTFNYIYFEAKTSVLTNPSTSQLSIRNIGITNHLYNYNNATPRPCIQVYLPDLAESIQKFALLHNTEIFINYQD